MTNRLDNILLTKQKEVFLLRQLLAQDKTHPIHSILRGEYHSSRTNTFKQALSGRTIAIIAEIKRRSPSKGQLASIQDPVQLAQAYLSGGANALSILTDTSFFGGHINDLLTVEKAVGRFSIPILRKDFIIDKIQIAEALAANASAVLFIVAALGNKLSSYLDYAKGLGMEVLVEVHSHDELKLALDSGAEIIGINNRDLKTFQIDTQRASELIVHLPDGVIKVAESGIDHPQLVRHYQREGFDAVLIGEALVKSIDPAAFIRSCYE